MGMLDTQQGEPVEHVTDVLVVGAGPTGLMLANWLVKLGVTVTLIDAKDGPTDESRAIGVHSRSMELYDQLGVVGRVLEQSVRAESMRQGYGRTAFAPIPLTTLGRGLTPYPGMYLLEQSANERILADNLREVGGSVQWGHRLAALDRADGGVLAHGDAPAGAWTVRARFAVGCDGASFTVRASSGTAFEGTTAHRTFYLVDAVEVDGLAPASVNIRQGATEFLLAFPMRPDGRGRNGQRLIGVASDDDTPAVTEDYARTRIAEAFGVTYGYSRWFSTYRVHHRVAERFRTGPVFLAGDAAHVHSPVGAQGMNTGLQDAHNLAFALADVILRDAPERVLDRYEAERRPVALRLLRTTDAVFRGITSRSRPATLLRRYVPRFVLPIAVAVLPYLPIGRRLAGYLGQIRIRYRMPGAEEGRRRRHDVVGRRLPWTGGNFDALRAARWQVHAYGTGADAPEAAAVAADLGLELCVFTSRGTTRLRAGTLYLVRPDGFVAGAAPPVDAPRAFRAVLAAQAPHLLA